MEPRKWHCQCRRNEHRRSSSEVNIGRSRYPSMFDDFIRVLYYRSWQKRRRYVITEVEREVRPEGIVSKYELMANSFIIQRAMS